MSVYLSRNGHFWGENFDTLIIGASEVIMRNTHNLGRTMYLKSNLLILIFLFGLSSCGDLFTKELTEKEVTLPQLGSCELNTEAFSFIFEKNIQGDIECLKEKLNLFASIVETDRPGFISKKVLKDFLLTGPYDVDPEIVDIIDSIFDLSYIILASDINYIKTAEMDQLLDFLKFFNKHVWKVYGFFNSDDEINYVRHLRERKIIFNEIALISDELKRIFKNNSKEKRSIDLENFFYNFFKNDPGTLEKLRAGIFLKRVFLGGNKWELSHLEFFSALEILPDLSQVTFDIAKVQSYTFSDQQDILIKVFQRDVQAIRDVVYFDPDTSEAIFTTEDLTKAIDVFTDDLIPIEVSKYPKEVKKLKEIFLGSGGDFFSPREIYNMLDHVDEIFAHADLFYRVYDFYSEELNSKEEISHDFSDFPVSTSTEKRYLDYFATIANNYKFLKGSYKIPYFTFDYYRNANSMFEVMTYEYAITQVMAYYGQKNPLARGGYDMTVDQSYDLIFDFKDFLRDEGIITIGKVGGTEIEGVSNKFVLLSTLFQYQSDGCNSDTVCMEVPEATEFVIGMVTAIGLKDFFTDAMIDKCATDLDEYNRIYPQCFRENFINVLDEPIPGEDGRSISDYMPYFRKYLGEMVKDIPSNKPITESSDYMHFILETEAFTRTCTHYDEAKTEEIPLKANDAFAVFAGLLNVESTVMRFDQDGNNLMDYRNADGVNEVMYAYNNVYKGAIEALVAPNGGFLTKMAKPVYQYLIKYGSVPDTKNFKSMLRFLKFWFFKRNKNANADRATVATVLKVIGEQQDTGENPFKCEECLRDPTKLCEPEGDEWDE